MSPTHPVKSYDVFLSYARSASTRPAIALKEGLEKFDKKWHQPFSTRVFFDNKALVAAPSLSGAIELGLQSSRFLAIFLSEAAAQSPWVDQEIKWWLTHRGADQLLLLHSDGIARWEIGSGNESAKGSFSSDSTAVPPALRQLTDEPRWVDFTWFDQAEAPEADPRMTDCVLEVFCPVHGVNRTDAIAANDRTVRRNKRLFRAGLTGLLTLSVVSLSLAALAYAQTLEAQAQTRTATARSLAAGARLASVGNDGRALELAVNAYGVDEDSDTLAALYATWFANPELSDSIVAPDDVTSVFFPASSGPVIGLADGRVMRWDTAGGRLLEVGTIGAQVEHISASDNGTIVVASTRQRSVAFVGGTSLPGNGPGCISHTGRQAVLGTELIDFVTQQRTRLNLPVTSFNECAFTASDTSVALLTGSGWVRVDVTTRRVVGQEDWVVNPNYAAPVISPDGESFVHRMGLVPTLDVYDTQGSPKVRSRGVVGPGINALYAISYRGQYAATAGGQDIYVTPTTSLVDSTSSPWDAEAGPYRVLNGLSGATALAFQGDGHALVAAAGPRVALWDLHEHLRGGAASDGALPQTEGLLGRRLSVSPDGAHALVWSGGGAGEVYLIEGASARTRQLHLSLQSFDPGIGWATDSDAFATLDHEGNPTQWFGMNGSPIQRPERTAVEPPALGVGDGRRLNGPDPNGVVEVVSDDAGPLFSFREWNPAVNSRGERQTLTEIAVNGAYVYTVTGSSPKWPGQSIRVYAVDKQQVIKGACAAVDSPMSAEAWSTFAPGVSRPEVCT